MFQYSHVSKFKERDRCVKDGEHFLSSYNLDSSMRTKRPVLVSFSALMALMR